MKLMELAEAMAAVKDGALVLPEGRVLAPQARRQLQAEKVKIFRAGEATGGKPEGMTHLNGKVLVRKDHPRIGYRGKVDTFQAEIVFSQILLSKDGKNDKIIKDLQEILDLARRMVRAEVLDEAQETGEDGEGGGLLGVGLEELHRQSHDPEGVFGVGYMTLPDWRMGLAYGLLNRLRALAREVEVAGVAAFGAKPTAAQKEILRVWNRVSSGVFVMMCRVLAGQYG